MERFLYVFDENARDELITAGFQILKSDKQNNVYVFANRMDMAFELSNVTFVRSNTLTF
jgi:hypothetical protein